MRKRGKLACFRPARWGEPWGWSVFVLLAPCSVGPARVSAEDFPPVGAFYSASRLQLSLVVRISHERGDFCRRVAVDFLRKTIYLRKARKPAHLVRILHCHGQFPPPLQRSRAYAYIQGCHSTSTKCAFSIQVDLRPEPPHTNRLRTNPQRGIRIPSGLTIHQFGS